MKREREREREGVREKVTCNQDRDSMRGEQNAVKPPVL